MRQPYLSDVPFVKIILPFIFGIISGLLFFVNQAYSLLSMAILGMVAILIITLTKKYSQRYMNGFGFSLLLFLSGALIILFRLNDLSQQEQMRCDGQCIALLKESIEPKSKSNAGRLIVYTPQGKRDVLVYFEKDSLSSSLKAGDHILVEGMIQPVGKPMNPYVFDYRKYCYHQGITGQIYLSSKAWSKADRRNGFHVKCFFINLRDKCLSLFRTSQISNDSFALLSGMVFGYTSDLEDHIFKSFSDTGVVHILSVSGLHVGIVYLLLGALLFFLNKRTYAKVIKSIIIIIGVWCYAALSGFEEPALRAATMFSFIELGRMIGRTASSLNAVAASAFFLLMINPLLIVDVGFQLSYMAVIGLVVWYKPLYNLWQPPSIVIDKVWALTCVSLMAQLATLPLSLYYFHRFPVYFLPANLLLVPFASIILYYSLLLLPLMFFLQTGWHISFLNAMIESFLGISQFISQIPLASIYPISVNAIMVIAIIFAMILITHYFIYRIPRLIYLVLIGILISSSSIAYDRIVNYNKSEVCYFKIKNKSLIAFSFEDKSYLFCNDTITEDEHSFIISEYFIKRQLDVREVLYIGKDSLSDGNLYSFPIGQASQLVCQNENSLFIIGDNLQYSGQCDKIYLTEKFKGKIGEVCKQILCKEIIFASSCNKKMKSGWKNECRQLQIKWIDLEDGGFITAHSFR